MLRYINTLFLAAAVLAVLGLSACGDDELNGPAPAVTIRPATIDAVPGETVDISISVESDMGFSALQYTVNGGDRITAQVSITNPTPIFVIPFQFQVPAEALFGDSYEIALYVIDADNVESAAATVTINIVALIDVPSDYTFTRDGASTVSFSGQTDRLNQVAEMKSYIAASHDGITTLSSADLYAMFVNTNGDGGGNFSFSSDRQLADKTFAPDVSYYETLFDEAEAASLNAVAGTRATEGTAGLIARASGSDILVNAKGHEFVQMVEKGLMGAVFYNQIYNVYLTDNRIGDDVNNVDLVEGKNYTAMEHHWDEAFGYFGVPVDYPGTFTEGSADDRFWAKYTYDRDVLLDVNTPLMQAYIGGRAAIVNRDYVAKDNARDVLYTQHELVAAATAIHYINTSAAALDQGEVGELFHQISEAYMFTNALRFSPNASISQADIDLILNTDFGTDADFWTVTSQGLNNARDRITAAFPQLAPIADSL